MLYTECPNCHTRYRVSVTDLRAAQGRVRCSHCQMPFDAMDFLSEGPNVRPTQSGTPPPSAGTATLAGKTPQGGGMPSPPGADPAAATQQPAYLGQREHPGKPARHAARAPAPPMVRSAGATAHGDLPFEVPDDLPDLIAPSTETARAEPAGRAHWLLWGGGCLLLLLALGLQLAWLERDQLNRHSAGQGFLQALCRMTGCVPPAVADLQRIRIRSREVRAGSSVPQTLLADVVFVNESAHPQPLPLLQLRLYTGDNVLAAARTFRPEEYLPADRDAASPLAPGSPIRVHLQLVDPGDTVTGFQFEFL